MNNNHNAMGLIKEILEMQIVVIFYLTILRIGAIYQIHVKLSFTAIFKYNQSRKREP